MAHLWARKLQLPQETRFLPLVTPTFYHCKGKRPKNKRKILQWPVAFVFPGINKLLDVLSDTVEIISIRLHFDPLLLYSHAKLPISKVERFDDGVFQVLFCLFETVKMCFAVVYRPPDAIVFSFTDVLQFLANNRHYTGCQ